MCTVSLVLQGWQQPSSPNYIPWPVIQSDPTLAARMLEVLYRLEQIDRRLGTLENCKVSEVGKEAYKRELAEAAGSGPQLP